ncbi:MAG TPA: ATP-binding protein [Elusimicrobiota bacterium]|nr:ATP-binding protein [Elusimicrobiota bacterium]
MTDVQNIPLSKVDPNDTKVELSCRTTHCILLYLEDTRGEKAMRELIRDTGMNLDYLKNPNNWISFDYFRRLLAKLVEFTGDPNAAYLAGTYSSRGKSYGALSDVIVQLATPRTAFKLIELVSPRFSKIGETRVTQLKRTSCTITSHYYPEYRQDRNNCLNMQGIFAAVPTLLRLPQAKIRETVCAAETGGSDCVYHVEWTNRPTQWLGLVGAAVALLLYLILHRWDLSHSYITLTLFVLLGYITGRFIDNRLILADTTSANQRETANLMEAMETIEKMNIELQEKIVQRTEELKKSNLDLRRTLEELQNSQKELIQSEKMASVGRLAAGMAHEINNPVGAIRNYLQDVLEDTPETDPRWDRLKRAEKATGRCKNIVADLLTFSRDSKNLKQIDMNTILDSVVHKTKDSLPGPQIVLRDELSRDLPPLQIDQLQIEQVMMNILMNAVDAIGDEGTITITSRHDGTNIFIDISDTGPGIPPDVMNKIFDPFFTTKPAGQGTGLGLAISYNLIKRFQGDIQVRNNPEKGATFTLRIPIQENQHAR